MTNPISLLLVLLLLPLIWSAIIQVLRNMAGSKPAIFHDRTEKAVMAIMCLPVLAGLVFLAIGPLVSPLNRTHIFYPPVFDEVAQVAVQALPQLAPQGPDLVALGTQTLLVLYGVGLAFTLWRWWQCRCKLTRMVKTAHPTEADQNVLCSDLSPTAFAWGRQRIIVPSVLYERLSASEIGLVLAHERAHQRRGDPFYFMALSLIEAVFWFNPLFARQAKACRLAAELACDAAVVGDEPNKRKAYARALMLALKHSSGHDTLEITLVPALLSDKEAYRMRLSHILTRATHPRSAPIWLVAMFTLTAPVLMLQMAFAGDHKIPALPGLPAATSSPVHVKTGSIFHTSPVNAPMSSPFGTRKHPFSGETMFHSGVDFNLPTGTPVKAPASGTVTGAAIWGKYGQIVEIDHGSGFKTRFAHLSQSQVKWGDHVTEGEIIALSGDTGQSTHPHLHLEVWQNEKVVDPASVMAFQSQ